MNIWSCLTERWLDFMFVVSWTFLAPTFMDYYLVYVLMSVSLSILPIVILVDFLSFFDGEA